MKGLYDEMPKSAIRRDGNQQPVQKYREAVGRESRIATAHGPGYGEIGEQSIGAERADGRCVPKRLAIGIAEQMHRHYA